LEYSTNEGAMRLIKTHVNWIMNLCIIASLIMVECTKIEPVPKDILSKKISVKKFFSWIIISLKIPPYLPNGDFYAGHCYKGEHIVLFSKSYELPVLYLEQVSNIPVDIA